jgi:hypothetical protein
MKPDDLERLIAEMKSAADARPFHPLGRHAPREFLHYRRDIKIDGYAVCLTLTRTVLPSGQHFYQFSLTSPRGVRADIPAPLVEKLKMQFVPKGFPIPSILGNCYQWLEPIR